MNKIIDLESIPSLEQYVPASTDLSSEYWTPEDGDIKRLIFWGVEPRDAPDHNDPEKSVQLDCCVFLEPSGNGQFATLINGSKRLVAAFQNNDIEQGTPVQVTYKGKRQNRTNPNKSDFWSVVTLKAPAAPKQGK